MGIKLGRGNTVHADAIEGQPEDSVTRCGRSADMVAGVNDAVTCKSCVKLTEADERKAASTAEALASLDAKAQALIEETNELIDAIEQRHSDAQETVPAEPVHYGYDKIVSGLPTGGGLATVALRDGDTAVAPGTTKRVFQGPATITYRAYCDGGMDVVDAGTAMLVSVPRREVRAPVEPSSMLIGTAGYGRTTDDRIDGPKRFRAVHGKRKTHTVRRFRRG